MKIFPLSLGIKYEVNYTIYSVQWYTYLRVKINKKIELELKGNKVQGGDRFVGALHHLPAGAVFVQHLARADDRRGIAPLNLAVAPLAEFLHRID